MDGVPLRRAVLPLAALASLLAAGCGGGDPTPHAQAQEAPGARVIRGWADDVRHGRYAQAAARFDVPATVQNGTPPLVLDPRTQVDLFNRSLPCGAVLLATRRIEGGR